MKTSSAIAIGGFDGMHLGHQKLFSQLGVGGTIVVIETGYANLTPKKEREHYTHYPIFYLQLDDIRQMSGAEFVQFLQKTFPKLQKIVVGYDFHFGKDRKYSFENLKELFDGEVVVVDEVKYKGDSVHSHKIRQKITIGDIKGANAFLGHNYTIRGQHIVGQGLGKKELVATINIEVEDFLIPKEGVYATLTQLDESEGYHPSVTFIGKRVSTDNSFAIETHLLDGDVAFTEKVSISFVAFLRENQKFENLSELKNVIQKDIALASKELKFLQL
ncbi:FMN adenylyltransferase / Riboflavin kinase [hydrothermal vent metagenome]|uniref:Bifunctional riboflavin kinase/FMN adenylyltransferase n=1 Tax=hydrothermal vent metagenome TaxID=652676 RepID=A0A1W1D3C5_9ZZZZ